MTNTQQSALLPTTDTTDVGKSAVTHDSREVISTRRRSEASAADSGPAAKNSTPPDRVRKTERSALDFARHHVGFTIALLFVAIVLVAALFPGLLATHDPYATSPAEKLTSPSSEHWFGTDELGRDLYSRVVHGTGTTILASLLSITIALGDGLLLGLVAGVVGGVVDALIMRTVDVLLAIPGLLLALTLVTALGFGTLPVAVAIGVGLIPGFARTTRAQVLRVRTLPYVEAAKTSGSSWGRVVFRHVLPNSWGPVLVLAVLDFGSAIMAVAALSFLGFGAQPPTAEWGSLINAGRDFLITAPWLSLLPGLVVVATVFAVNHIGKTIEDLNR